jgi:hypothetical protein
MLAAYKIRIIGNACITRYDAGEGTLTQILGTNYSGLLIEDRTSVINYVIGIRSDIQI